MCQKMETICFCKTVVIIFLILENVIDKLVHLEE